MPAPAVLIADDDDLLRRLMQRVLEAAGMRVLTAADGEQALAVLTAEPAGIAVVVLDLTMPPHGGIETAQRVLSMRPGIGVVLTSGLPPEAAVSELLAKYRGVFLRKPFAPQALGRTVGELIARGGA
ncbi:MAG: response regulator [Deltaproteobacteria bacterium]|nr:response regulator [Deltaproteobacteria bacterium]